MKNWIENPPEVPQRSNSLSIENSSKQNILVTGSTGFVGRPLCDKLLLNGFNVRGSVWIAEAPANLPAGVQAAPIESIGPVTDWSASLTEIDTVIHLAARMHVMDEDAVDPLAEFRRVNVAGTERLARQATAAGVRRLVFLSSVKVNGDGRLVTYTEDDPPAPEDPYGVSKREAEDVLRRIAVDTGLEVVIIRPPLVYGPGVKANFLRLLRMVERGEPLPLASINNARSLVYLGNLIDAIITCATHPRAAGQTFLVSDGEDVSTPKLIRQMANALDRTARLIPFPPSLIRLAGKIMDGMEGNFGFWTLNFKLFKSIKTIHHPESKIQNRVPRFSSAVDWLLGSLVVDSSKIRRELGWRPPFTMDEGLAETAKWFRKQ
jgi:UDP-N-acetyl-alpha-D-quinovosamine dehydrogenase